MARKTSIIFQAPVVGRAAGTVNADRGVGDARNFTAFLDVSASTGTAETLDVKFQEQDPASTDWIDIASAAFAQATGITSERIAFTTNADRIRCVQVIAGTTPTFDYSVGAVGA